MYNLQEFYNLYSNEHLPELWNGIIACAFTDKDRTLMTNELKDSLNCYTFTFIRQGELSLMSGGSKLSFFPNDIYTYYPGSSVYVSDVSDDYRGICLLVDEQMTHSAQAFRNLLRASMIPLSQFGNSKLTLAAEDANRILTVLMLMSEYISRPLSLKNEILEMLYSVFINDLISIHAFQKARLSIPRQYEELFISFYALLQKNFIDQHNVGFYANRLNITTTYLSRVVKVVSGRTVMECIDEMLAIEATWLLKSTSLTVTQIADRLNFASAPSFDKFYKRMRGCTPLSVRG